MPRRLPRSASISGVSAKIRCRGLTGFVDRFLLYGGNVIDHAMCDVSLSILAVWSRLPGHLIIMGGV